MATLRCSLSSSSTHGRRQDNSTQATRENRKHEHLWIPINQHCNIEEKVEVGTNSFPILSPTKSKGRASGALSTPSMTWYFRKIRPSETHLLSSLKASGYRSVKSALHETMHAESVNVLAAQQAYKAPLTHDKAFDLRSLRQEIEVDVYGHE